MMWMEEKQPKVLTDVYPDWLTNGIFKQLEQFDVPWKSYVDGSTLDLDYYGNRSGEKIISALLEKLLTDNVLTPATQSKIAALLWYKYGHNWKRAWDALQEEYNPIHNYSMTRKEIVDETLKIDEDKTSEKTVKDTGTLDKKNTGSVSVSSNDTLEHTTTNEYSSNTENDIYGFNSTTASDADKSSTTQNNSSTANDTSTTSSTTTDDKDELVTRDLTVEDNVHDVEDNTHKRDSTTDVTQTGNIGVTTSQQMLESEIQLRFDINIFNLIFRDVDDVLTINIFKKKEIF